MLLWFECAGVLLLAFSQPLWASLFTFLSKSGTQPSPAVLLLCSFAFLASAAGLLLSLPPLQPAAERRVVRLERARPQRPHAESANARSAARADLCAPFSAHQNPRGQNARPRYGFHRRIGRVRLRAARLRGADSLVRRGRFFGGTPPYAGVLAVLAAAWSAAVLACVRGIARTKTAEPAESAGNRRFPAWILQLPLLLLLYGFAASLLPVLRLSLDSAPAVGAARILYPLVRAGFLTMILYLLQHAPAKLALLAAPRKTHLSPSLFYAAAFLGFLVNLLLDAFRAM